MLFGAARSIWQTGRAMAGAAINAACAALLASLRARPYLLLTTAQICFRLRRPLRACDAVAVVSAIDVRQIADPDRTAAQMTKIAAALCTRGLRVEARNVLRKAIALAPHVAASRSALIGLLEEDLRAAGGNIPLDQWGELEDLLQQSMVELAAPRRSPTCTRRMFTRKGPISGSPERSRDGRRNGAESEGGDSVARGTRGRTVSLCSPTCTC